MKDYEILQDVVVRTPRNSFDQLMAYYNCIMENPSSEKEFQDALRIASLDLYTELTKISNLTRKQTERVKYSIFRYIARMSTRCTPFGLFAGCAICRFGERTNLTISKKIVKHTRLDMSYLCSLSQYLSNLPEVKYKLKYYPNSSLYKVGNEYRYISYEYLKDERIHQICSINKTSYLDSILRYSKKGCNVKELLPFVSNEYIPKEESANYIDSLIESQVLVSELDPNITGDDFLTRMISILSCVDPDNNNLRLLRSVQYLIPKIDSSTCDPVKRYNEIESFIKKIGAPYNKKYLFQIDINNIFLSNEIGLNIKNEIESVAHFLNKINSVKENWNLINFKNEFIKRFEEEEIPLALALDPETGIGYPVSDSNNDMSTLLKGFISTDEPESLHNDKYDKIQFTILKKILNKEYVANEIELKDDDFKDATVNWDNLPDSFSAFFQIVKDTDTDMLIFLKFIGNNSAANLLTRFAYADKKIEELVTTITQEEERLHPESILAEIVHLPDSRVGNVLSHPHARNYELAILTNSTMLDDRVIHISDIMLSIRNGSLFLRSKRLHKNIIPYLTNSHNFSLSSVPYYRFLCDFQQQNKRITLRLDIDNLLNTLSHTPRIRYKRTILSLATWKVEVHEVEHLFAISKDEDLLYLSNQWREKKKIPSHSLLIDYDNELFIDWNNAISLRSFLSVVKTRIDFLLKEFLFDKNNLVVKDTKSYGYLNECIVSFIKRCV